MNVNVISNSGIIQAAQQVGVALNARQAKAISGHVCGMLANSPVLARDPKLQQSLLQLYFLKARLLRRGKARPKNRQAVRNLYKLRSQYRQLLGRFQARLRTGLARHQQLGRAATARWGDRTGQDYSFLSDPRLSTAEKLQRLLIELSSKYDAKAEELMKKLSESGQKKKSPSPLGDLGNLFPSIGKAVGAAFGGPVGAAAGQAVGDAVGGMVNGSGDAKQNEKVLEFELQRIMQRANQLFSMASQLQKNEHDTAKGIIGRMAV